MSADSKIAEAHQRRASVRGAARKEATSESPPPSNTSYTDSHVAEDRVQRKHLERRKPLPLTKNVSERLY